MTASGMRPEKQGPWPSIGKPLHRACSEFDLTVLAQSFDRAAELCEQSVDLLADRIKLREMPHDIGKSLLGLEFALVERFHACAERFVAVQFDLVEGPDQSIAPHIQVGDQGLDAIYRRLQGRKRGLGPVDVLPEAVQRR